MRHQPNQPAGDCQSARRAAEGRPGKAWASVFLLAVCFAATVCAQGDGGETDGRVLDRVVAIVGGRAITLSELDFEVRVALIQKGGLAAAESSLDDAALKSGLQLAIAQRLASDEADRLQAFPIDEGEVTGALQVFRDRFSSSHAYEEFLAREDTDEPHLATVIARSLRADHFLNSKVRLRVQVSEEEVRRAYQGHSGAQKYEDVRNTLREKLLRDKYERAVTEEIEQAKRGADVRWVAPFARDAQGATP